MKGSDKAWQARVAEEGLEPLDGTGVTRPRVLYKNLYRYTECFIGGSLYAKGADGEDCVAGANVTLSLAGQVVATTQSDDFGDFKFDRLKGESGTYDLQVEAEGYQPRSHQVTLGESQALDPLLLERAT